MSRRFLLRFLTLGMLTLFPVTDALAVVSA